MGFIDTFCLLALAAAGPPLTIEGAVDRALERAPELKAARHAQDAAEQRAGQARAAYWPRLSLEASYLAKWPKNELPIDLSELPFPPESLPDVGDVDDIHHLQAGLQMGWILFDLTRGPKVDALLHQAEAETAKIAEGEAQLAFMVRSTFLAALFARDVAAIAESSLQIARGEEKRARMRREVGTGTEVALAQAGVRRASLEAQARRANNELERHTTILASLIGEEQAPAIDGDLEVLSATAGVARDNLARSPVLLRLQATRQAALSSASAKSRALVPTVSAVGRAEMQYPRALETELGPVLSAGVSASWVFFDGFLRSSGVAEAEAQAQQAEESLQAMEEALSRRLIEIDARKKTASADLASARETLGLSEVYVRAANAAVEAGTGTDLEVSTAKNGLDQARIAVQQALLTCALVEAERLAVYGVSQ